MRAAARREPIPSQTTRPTNAVQLYAFGEPDGSTVKIGMSKTRSDLRKKKHQDRGPITVTMRDLCFWWGMPSDESYIKNHFAYAAKDGKKEWFDCDAAMRSWLTELRKQYFVAHTFDEIDEIPFVDSSAWLPNMNNPVSSAMLAGQLALSLPVNTADDPWADVTIERDHVGKGDFYTAPAITEAARAALGEIDLDPASCRLANREVKAKRYYSVREDGLLQPWYGRVWLNPPFPWELWVEKFCSEWDARNIQAAIVLCETRVTTAFYFQRMIGRSAAVLKMTGRHTFWGPKAGAPDEGHELYFYGADPALFAKAFAQFGRVFVPHQHLRLAATAPQTEPVKLSAVEEHR